MEPTNTVFFAKCIDTKCTYMLSSDDFDWDPTIYTVIEMLGLRQTLAVRFQFESHDKLIVPYDGTLSDWGCFSGDTFLYQCEHKSDYQLVPYKHVCTLININTILPMK
jgi:hypothetical protein